MIYFIGFIGMFIGRFLIGGLLNFILKEHEEPNPENYLGWIGAIIGGVLSMWIYHII